jgi:hypothetical protein
VWAVTATPTVGRAIMSDIVCVSTFPSRQVAELARNALETHGIAATVSAADVGYDISFASGGARLLVNRDSVDRAREVLESIQEFSTPNGGECSESIPSGQRWNLIWISLVILVLLFVLMAF